MADGVPFDQIGDDEDGPPSDPRYEQLTDMLFGDEGRALNPAEMQEFRDRAYRNPDVQYPDLAWQNAVRTNQARILTQNLTERLKAGQVGAHTAPDAPPGIAPPEMQGAASAPVQAPAGPSGPGRYHIETKRVPTPLSKSGWGWSIRQVFDK